MQDLNFIEKNVISPYKEMLAYETLWAIENSNKDLKEKDLKELFNHYTPSETLEQISNQIKFNFSSSDISSNKIEKAVNRFLDTSLVNELNTFSIVVNKNFQYPDKLNKTTCPIGLLYYKGNLDLLYTKCISIVGARTASAEGITRAKRLAKELTHKKFTIVSGLAKGIDVAAHQSAIENKGNTIGVIGTPINEYYPKENKELQDRIAKDFLLISQVPFYKYANEPFNHHKFHFPRRNMTMASISDATVIVEASETSGSHTQARECLKQKKKLFILDSCFNNPAIKWPLKYEKEGAIRIQSTEDIINLINE